MKGALRWTAIAAIALGCAGSQEHRKGQVIDEQAWVSEDLPGAREREVAYPSAFEENQGERDITPGELRAILTLAEHAENIRGLTFREPVGIYVQTKEQIDAYQRSKLDVDAVEKMRRRYLALGLLDPEYDFAKAVSEAAGEGVLAYYDYDRRALIMGEDTARKLRVFSDEKQLDGPRAVVIHELVHALQDQHFKLKGRIDRELHSDRRNAMMALIEGDATLVQILYSTLRIGVTQETIVNDGDLLEQILTGSSRTSGTYHLGPSSLFDPMAFRYQAGALFVARIVELHGWKGVNAAYGREPRASTEILNPDLYLARGGRAADVSKPPTGPLRRSGYRDVYTDSIGSIELTNLLSFGGVGGDDIAQSLRADRLALLEKGDSGALVWMLRFEDYQVAERAAALMNDVFARIEPRDGKSQVVVWRGEEVCVAASVPDAVSERMTNACRASDDHISRPRPSQ